MKMKKKAAGSFPKTIKDLPKDINLGQVKVKTPDGTIGWWTSQWQKGVWLRPVLGEGKIIPVSVNDLKETLAWEVLEVNNENLGQAIELVKKEIKLK